MATNVRDVEQKPRSEDEFLHYDHIGHGSTPAAWALSLTIILGGLLAGVGLIGQWWILVWIGAALVPVGIILGVVLKKMGYGVEMDSNSVLKQGADPREHQGPAIPDNTDGGAAKRKPASGSN
ncbi:HGxxPAAW family protein [Nesterenkonia flava]|uniref:HGxxPAAW family protein n=1 Tax=Nesterenkonia flava TaxID=469799 RepID=A0ABU1FVG5_9MICC|nr:HGxxPAAW family protein [Nesterenkonia flava]MDR5712671.1 HGxxPAAW family protein [Nesterenkonia flava]